MNTETKNQAGNATDPNALLASLVDYIESITDLEDNGQRLCNFHSNVDLTKYGDEEALQKAKVYLAEANRRIRVVVSRETQPKKNRMNTQIKKSAPDTSDPPAGSVAGMAYSRVLSECRKSKDRSFAKDTLRWALDVIRDEQNR